MQEMTHIRNPDFSFCLQDVISRQSLLTAQYYIDYHLIILSGVNILGRYLGSDFLKKFK